MASLSGESASVSITSGDMTYSPCSQDVFDGFFSNNLDWMSSTKKNSVLIHTYISAILVVLSILYIFLFSDLTTRLRYLFKATYKPSGEIYGTDFSNVPGDM